MPIPGTRRHERLYENLGSPGLDLTLDDLAELDNATIGVRIQGDRYPDAPAKNDRPLTPTATAPHVGPSRSCRRRLSALDFRTPRGNLRGEVGDQLADAVVDLVVQVEAESAEEPQRRRVVERHDRGEVLDSGRARLVGQR